jgi:hypothetical protein
MSVRGPEIDIFTQATNADDLNKGAYIHNMYGHADHLRLRSGFGQVHQFDTTLGLSTIANPVVYKKHLGSTLIRTGFGHNQVLSVFLILADTSNIAGEANRYMGRYSDLNVVQIYDLTTDEHWEEILYLQSGQTCKDIPRAHGFYESTISVNYETYPHASDKMCFFAEYNGAVIFGNEDVGIYSYHPASFSGFKWQQLNSISYVFDIVHYYSESSLIFPIMPNPGVFGATPDMAGAYPYFTTASFPKIVDGVNLQGRMCYIGNDGVLYFADANLPGSIATVNFISIGAKYPLTAVEEINGNLLIFSEQEMFFYQPAGSDIISGGNLTKLSDSIGCLGPNAITNAKGSLVWTDSNGVYLSQNGTDVKPIAGGIASFWIKDSGIAVPFTNFYHAAAGAGDNINGTSINYEFESNDDSVHVTYFAGDDLLFVVNPSQKMALVFDQTGWKVWAWESVDGQSGFAILEQSIVNPWLMANVDSMYLVGSTEDRFINDQTRIGGGISADEDITVGSYYLMEYGRGGNTDRSIEHKSEDDRIIAGKYYSDTKFQEVTGSSDVIIERWLKVDEGYQQNSSDVANDETWLLPIEIRADSPLAIADMDIKFRFDNGHYKPVFTTSLSTSVAFDLPPHLLWCFNNFTVTCEDDDGNPDRAGRNLHIECNHQVTGLHIPVRDLNRVPVLFIPMMRRSDTAISDLVSMGIKFIKAYWTITNGKGDYFERYGSAIYWQQASFGNRHSDDRGQSIDWCWKSNQIENNGGQIRLRNVFLKRLTHGEATLTYMPSNPFGGMNLIAASDWKDWSGQIVDHSENLQTIENKDDIVNRMLNTTDDAMYGRTFNNVAKWGNNSSGATGNFLIDNEQYDSVALSTSIKGEMVSVMLFGHIRDKAEDVRVNSVVVGVREGGGRRRIGR